MAAGAGGDGSAGAATRSEQVRPASFDNEVTGIDECLLRPSFLSVERRGLLLRFFWGATNDRAACRTSGLNSTVSLFPPPARPTCLRHTTACLVSALPCGSNSPIWLALLLLFVCATVSCVPMYCTSHVAISVLSKKQ
jgi:hypothetical protein